MRNSTGKRLQPSDNAELWGGWRLRFLMAWKVLQISFIFTLHSCQSHVSVSLLFFLMVTGSVLSLHDYHGIPDQFELLEKTKRGQLPPVRLFHYTVMMMVTKGSSPRPKSPFAKCLLSSSWTRPRNPFIPVNIPDKDTLICG